MGKWSSLSLAPKRQAKPRQNRWGFAERTHLCLRTYVYEGYKCDTFFFVVLQESLGLSLPLYRPLSSSCVTPAYPLQAASLRNSFVRAYVIRPLNDS